MKARTTATVFPSGTRARRKVERLIEPEPATAASGGKAGEVQGGRVRIDHGSERRRVGRDHDLVCQAAFQAKVRHAEVRVLIGIFQVADVIGGLPTRPRDAARLAELDLAAHRQPVGLVEQASGRRPHDQRWHQVFEHRTRPGHERRAVVDRRHGAAEAEPLARRHIAFGDGDKTGQPRFRGEQVVAIGVERAIRDEVADGQQLALGIAQEAELHAEGHAARRVARGAESRWSIAPSAWSDVAVVAVSDAADRLGPEHHIAR